MNREELPQEASREDKMRDALKHYEELATNACWHRSDIPDAIRAYYASLHPAEGAETEETKELEAIFNLEQELNIPMKDRFHNSEKGKALFDAIYGKQQPTAEGAEEILKKHMNGTTVQEYKEELFIEYNTVLAAMQEFATLHAQRIAEKMVSERLREDEDSNHVEQLREFHTAFGLPQRNIPTIMPSDEFKSRQNLLEEEVDELSTAYENGDIIEIADAITDCLYVLIGTALQFGIADALDECFDEVHKSNMSKLGLDGKPIVREDGKVMKGPNFRRPELYRILKPLSHDR